VPAFAMNGQRRVGSSLAIGLGVVAAVGAAASFVFGQLGADWLRFSLIAQVVVVAGLATVLARQIAAARRMQGSLLTANTDLARAQASLEANNRMLRAVQAELKRTRQQLIDGIEIMQWLAAQGATARVVVTTGYNPQYAKMADLVGADRGLQATSILTKPVRLADLRAALA
jgi:hypothetical protein